ncbi:CRISPR-associated endonuclease Cas1 [Nocardia sp. NPDC050697]|uniref:CRISPR-associated endonuclease Cas1 n=1 Tax=Nocardia sp. NPDC050697 TaxID=3155158 RepID=UPI0033D66D55
MLSHPLETVVYVERQGAVVRTRGDRLVVTDGEESLLRLSLRRVRQVVGFGAVGYTTPFLRKAVESGIDVVLLSENGTLGGRLSSPLTSDPSARRAQYRAADDDRRAKTLATAFVAGKVDNLRVSLLRIARRADDPIAAAGRHPTRSTPCCPTATPCCVTRPSPRSKPRDWTRWWASCTSTAGADRHWPWT